MADVRHSTVEDANNLAPHLRDADVLECETLFGVPPSELLPHAVLACDFTMSMINDEDEVMGMAGVGPTGIKGVGSIWMVSSEELFTPKYKRKFLLSAREGIEDFHKFYPTLTNVVDTRNVLHIRWLQWMGFRFVDVVPVGPERLPYLSFIRTR